MGRSLCGWGLGCWCRRQKGVCWRDKRGCLKQSLDNVSTGTSREQVTEVGWMAVWRRGHQVTKRPGPWKDLQVVTDVTQSHKLGMERVTVDQDLKSLRYKRT